MILGFILKTYGFQLKTIEAAYKIQSIFVANLVSFGSRRVANRIANSVGFPARIGETGTLALSLVQMAAVRKNHIKSFERT